MSRCSAFAVGGLAVAGERTNEPSVNIATMKKGEGRRTCVCSLVTLEARSRALVADDGVLD